MMCAEFCHFLLIEIGVQRVKHVTVEFLLFLVVMFSVIIFHVIKTLASTSGSLPVHTVLDISEELNHDSGECNKRILHDEWMKFEAVSGNSGDEMNLN